MILKARYHLTHGCINDILRLFRECFVEAPSSYKSMKNLLRKRSGFSRPQPSVNYICSSCSSASTHADTCTSCFTPISSNSSPILFFNFDISSQIERVICSSPNLILSKRNNNSSEIRDITDGEFYRRLCLSEHKNEFITLTLNVDGVAPHGGSDLSIWPIFLVINEIEKSKRFALENMIVAGVWPGPSKPSREQMFILFSDIVKQLKELENGRLFGIRSSDGLIENKFLKVRKYTTKRKLLFLLNVSGIPYIFLLRQASAVSTSTYS